MTPVEFIESLKNKENISLYREARQKIKAFLSDKASSEEIANWFIQQIDSDLPGFLKVKLWAECQKDREVLLAVHKKVGHIIVKAATEESEWKLYNSLNAAYSKNKITNEIDFTRFIDEETYKFWYNT